MRSLGKELMEGFKDFGITRRFYYIKDVEKIIGCNRQSLRRWWEKGIFPIPKKHFENGRLYWPIEAIDEWIKNKEVS